MKTQHDPRRNSSSGQPLTEDLLKGFESVGEPKFVPNRSAAPVQSSASVSPRARVVETTQPVTAPTVKVSTKQAESIAVDPAFAPPPNFDAAFQSEGLPSNFTFYSFQTLHMRPFVPRDQLSIYRGRSEGNIRYVADSISASIKADALELTNGDFWYLMYQQRLKSYKKSPFLVTWTCVSDKHLQMIENLEKLLSQAQNAVAVPASADSEDTYEVTEEQVQEMKVAIPSLEEKLESLKKSQFNITTVQRSDLLIDEILPERRTRLEEIQKQIFDDYQVKVTAPRMRTVVAAIEEQQNSSMSAEDSSFLDFFNRYAGCLDDEHGATLSDKRKFINDSPHTDLLNDIDKFLELMTHGVKEQFKCTCKGCGIVEKVDQTIDIPHFFPGIV